MNPLFTDPVFQTCLVGIAINAVGAIGTIYLRTEDRRERHLLFWTLSWLIGTLRWIIHDPAETDSVSRVVEALVGSCALTFIVSGAYEVLAAKPWRLRPFAWSLAAVLALYVVAGALLGGIAELGCILLIGALVCSVVCMWRGYRLTRFSGYAVGLPRWPVKQSIRAFS